MQRWRWPRPDRDERWVSGTAGGIAAEIGVQPAVIRISFVVLAAAGGWGLVLYAAAWASMAVTERRHPGEAWPRHPKAATPAHRVAGVIMITVGLVMAVVPLTNTTLALAVWPVGVLASGMLIAWTSADDGGAASVVRVLAGLTVAVAGFAVFVFTRVELADALVALVLAGAVIGGIALVAAPSIVRLGRDLDRERLERTRSEERARVNAHLHDSVLQTLTLIQQQSDDPARTRRLARRQERELRNWLYGTSTTSTDGLRLGPALEHAASAVEDDADTVIEVVTVGDFDDVDPSAVAPLIAATREAMRNAARHSGADRVSVFAERTSGHVEVFVRDDGIGFDAEDIPLDRQGIRGSIIARMTDAGGSATIHARPGAGTEVELSLPLGGSS
ncbi:MAG: ATP-binding protein [Ilumatobacter sp.]